MKIAHRITILQGGKLNIPLVQGTLGTLAVLALLSIQCSSPKPLSDAEKAKLDSHLIQLFSGKQMNENLVTETLRDDGSIEYAVIVRSEHPEEIKALGIEVSSVFGDVIVVHATIDELRKILLLPSVRSMQAGSRNSIQQHH
jgi:hypothetical protein